MRNPLDPDAWLTESHRFDMAGEGADIRLGVHATDSFDTALAYAVHKASQEGDLGGGQPNCGIIFELDMGGLEPLPEADAIIASRDGDIVVDALEEDPTIVSAFEAGDHEALADAVLREVERLGVEEVEWRYNWFEDYWREYVFKQGPWVILPVLGGIAESNSRDLFLTIKDAFEFREFPLDYWAEAIGQWRFLAPVGFDRLRRVWAVHPVDPGMLDWGEEWDEEGPMQASPDWLEPETVLLWDSGRKNGGMYHGTDISRARRAFPELADVIVSPWPFGQPEGVGP